MKSLMGFIVIQLLESPIPTSTTATTPTTTSQKASSGDISGTKRGSTDPLVSKRPQKILYKKIKKSSEDTHFTEYARFEKV